MFNHVARFSLRRLGQSAAIAAALVAMTPAFAGPSNFSAFLQCRSTQLTEFPGTIVEAAVATPQLSTLVSLVQAADLAGALSGNGPFTVFAPTNDAFAKVPAPLLSLIGGDTQLLTRVLTYHVVAGKVDPRRSLMPMQVPTLQGQTVFLGYNAGSAVVNQSGAACKGVKTSNGIVWIVDSVLLPQFK
jgi:uncharacterized surface protein with fasciclin (FAS1) repeats